MGIRSSIACLALAGVALAAAPASTAHAEEWLWSRGDFDARERLKRHHGGIAAEHTTYAGDLGGAQALLQSPLVGFWYAITEHFVMSADWGMAYYRENAGGDASRTFRFGNPMVSGYYVGRFGSLKLYAGLGVAAPAATLPDGPDPDTTLAARAYMSALATRGGWNSFLWIPEAASLVFPVRFESAGVRHLLLAADAAMGVPIFLDGRGAGLVFQTAGEVGYRSEHFSIGARMQLFWWALDDRPFIGDDMAQMSLEPFLRVDFGRPFLHARLTMNLDEPFGFSFDDGGIWGLHLGGGVEF
ncbi:MAG: hypothetical protein ACODAU_12045 [Myxococcota bacterium]